MFATTSSVSPIGMASTCREYKGWSSREEAKLVEILVDMVNNGEFVSGNGFTKGYLGHLEQQLKLHFPKSGFCGKPHIESKVRLLKKDWMAVYDMLNGPNASGFGFLAGTNLLDAPESVWDDYLARNPKSAKWKTKDFPHYNDLCKVFGKDGAQGNGAMNIVEIKDGTNTDAQASGDDLDGTMEENIDTQSYTNEHGEEPSSVHSGKRKSRADEELPSFLSRKKTGRVDAMVDVSSEACNTLGTPSKIRNYKGWSSREEAKLVELLVDMVNNDEFISDNGFKCGYLLHLEQQLKLHFPKSGLTGKHIESKVRTLKKDWCAVYDMLSGPNTSGFCFLGDINMLDAPESVWNDYLAHNPKLTKWKTKEFPHYNDLCKVFGKDGAQANGAMNITEKKDGTNTDVQASGVDLNGTMEENIDTQSYTNEHVEEPSSVHNGKRKNQADEEPPSFLGRKKKSRVDAMGDVSSEACTSNILGTPSKVRNYKGWSSREEAKLVELLVDMVDKAEFVSNNGFKSGYSLHLEQQLKVHFPKSGLTCKHIESKVRTLKNDWIAVHDMLNGPNTSEFCFLDDANMLDAPESVWDDYLMHNPKSSKLKTKEFPHYFDLCLVFGKEQAQGNGAMNIVEIKDDTNIDVPDSGDSLDGNMDDYIDTRSNTNDHVEEPSSVRSGKGKCQADEEPSSVRSRKEKSRLDPMVEVLSEACNILGNHIYKAATKMSREVELEEVFEMKVELVISELSKMKSLSQLERFKAIDIITSNPRHVKIFWGLNDEEREAWVKYKLQE